MHTRSKKYTSSQTPLETLTPALFMVILSFLHKKAWLNEYKRLYQVSHACRGTLLQTKLMGSKIAYKASYSRNFVPIAFFLKNCAAPLLRTVELTNEGKALGARGVFVDGFLMQLAAGHSPYLRNLHLSGLSVGGQGVLAFSDAVAAGHFLHLKSLVFANVWFDPLANDCKLVVEALLQIERLPSLKGLGWRRMNAVTTDRLIQGLARGACGGLRRLVLNGSHIDDRRLEMLLEALHSGKRIHHCALSIEKLCLRKMPMWKYHNMLLCQAVADPRFAPALKKLAIGFLQRWEKTCIIESKVARQAKMGTALCITIDKKRP
jgi:hypothetical protein